MSKKNQNPKGPNQTPAEIADGIRVELRGIIRQWDKLRQPFNNFTKAPGEPEAQSRWVIEGTQSVEEIHDQFLRFAGAVW